MEIVHEDWREACFDEVQCTVDFDSLVEAQKVVLYSISSAGFGPKAADPKNPGVRIYGTFETADAAMYHAKRVMERHPHVSMLSGEVGTWTLAAKDPSSLPDQESKIQDRLDAYYAREKLVVEEFEAARDAKKVPLPKKLKPPKKEQHALSATLDHSTISSDLRDPKQTVAVCPIIKDEGKDAEFVFRVYACLKDESTAQAYIHNSLSKDVTDVDIFVTSLHEWMHPQKSNLNAVHKTYRSKQLQNIVDQSVTNDKRVKDYDRIFMKK